MIGEEAVSEALQMTAMRVGFACSNRRGVACGRLCSGSTVGSCLSNGSFGIGQRLEE